MYPTITRRAVASLLLFATAACGDRPDAVGTAPEATTADAARRGLSLDIARSGERLAVGDTMTIEVSRSISRARIARWLSSDEGIATVTSRGLVRGLRAGTARITVLSSGGSQVTTLTVVDSDASAPVVRVEVMAPSSTVPVGGQMALTAVARDASGAVVSGRTARWSRAAGTAASINATGMLTAVSTGPVTVRATVDGVSDDRTFAVTAPVQDGPAPTITALQITPREDIRLVPRATEQFDATATWSNGESSEPQVTWSTTRGTITTGGRYTAPSTNGTFLVIATLAGDTLADTVSVLVAEEAPTVTAFSIAPASGPALAPGATRQFTRNVSWSDGRSRSVGVTFTATGGTITTNGLYRAGQVAGAFMVIANCSCGRADTAAVVISQAVAQLASLTITPAAATMQAGSQRQFSADAVWSTGSTSLPPITYSATGGTIAQTGLYTAPSAAGTYRVIVAHTGGQLRDTAVVTVTAVSAPVTLTSMTISPSSVTLTTGGTRQFAVSGTWSDGGSATPPATYSATGGTVSASGLYTAPATAGTYRVIAAHSGGTRRDTAVVTVQSAAITLTSMSINPATVTMPAGATQQFAVSGTWSNGSTTPPSVTYSATGGSVTPAGVFTAPSSAGTYRVIAAQSGGTLRDTSVVTVTASTGGGTTPPPSGAGACPNEPAGYARYGDVTFPTINVPSGWSILGNDRALLADATGPVLGTSVGFKHAAGDRRTDRHPADHGLHGPAKQGVQLRGVQTVGQLCPARGGHEVHLHAAERKQHSSHRAADVPDQPKRWSGRSLPLAHGNAIERLSEALRKQRGGVGYDARYLVSS